MNRTYPYIRAWGTYLGSFPYYINDQIALATKDGAPERSIYKSHEGQWVTFDEIENLRVKALVQKYVDTVAVR